MMSTGLNIRRKIPEMNFDSSAWQGYRYMVTARPSSRSLRHMAADFTSMIKVSSFQVIEHSFYPK